LNAAIQTYQSAASCSRGAPKRRLKLNGLHGRWQACLLVFAEFISSTLEMEAICSSETSAETQRTTRRHIPENDTLQFKTDAYIQHSSEISSKKTKQEEPIDAMRR
jgi:hypothetical protein